MANPTKITKKKKKLLFSLPVVCVCVEGATCSACVACLTGWPNALNRPRREKEKRRRRIKRNRERVYSIRMSLPREQSKRKEENSDESRRERERLRNELKKKKTVFFLPAKEEGKKKRPKEGSMCVCVRETTTSRSLLSCRRTQKQG
jgi:hypothetical protein